jgi:hypothetical protein
MVWCGDFCGVLGVIWRELKKRGFVFMVMVFALGNAATGEQAA